MIKILSERLKEQRELKHLSQKDVASALNMSASIISNYENGERLPSLENLITLARFYKCSTDYLLGIDKNCNCDIDTSMLSDKQIRKLQDFLVTLDSNIDD